MMNSEQSRREFLKSALAAGVAIQSGRGATAAPEPGKTPRSPLEKLNLAAIGVGGRGAGNLKSVAGENVVALCDIDAARLAKAAEMCPQAMTCDDYRRVFELDDVDGVVISTPDHMHAIPVAEALRRNWAVYCEKPLAYSVFETRNLVKLAAASNSVTQMGNQIHAGQNYRRVVDIVKAGVIGPVRRVHVWQGGTVKPGKRVTEGKVPAGISYDLWIGPAPYRPFHPSHFHFDWRFWWDFGGGQLTDFVCHYMDLPYWALDLKYPTTIIADGEKAHDGDNDVPGVMRVEYSFAARGDQPPVHVTWYHGGWKPKGAEVYGKNSAVLFEGEDGRLLADYSTRKLFMQAGKEAHPVEPTIPDSIGHHREWLQAIKTGSPTSSPFEYGALLTEAGQLGNVSYRAGTKRLEWNAEEMRAPNCPESDQFLHREYRQGWSL